MASPARQCRTSPVPIAPPVLTLSDFYETIELLADLEQLKRQNLLLEFEDEHGVQRFAVRQFP